MVLDSFNLPSRVSIGRLHRVPQPLAMSSMVSGPCTDTNHVGISNYEDTKLEL